MLEAKYRQQPDEEERKASRSSWRSMRLKDAVQLPAPDHTPVLLLSPPPTDSSPSRSGIDHAAEEPGHWSWRPLLPLGPPLPPPLSGEHVGEVMVVGHDKDDDDDDGSGDDEEE